MCVIFCFIFVDHATRQSIRLLHYNLLNINGLELVITRKFVYLAFSDRRLADHFGGKLHLGYMLIREKLADLQVRIHNPLCLFS